MQVLERTGKPQEGLTTFAPDGAYLAGPVPRVDGPLRHHRVRGPGIAGSAAVGRWLACWLASWLMRGDPGEDLSSVSLDRFGDEVSGRD